MKGDGRGKQNEIFIGKKNLNILMLAFAWLLERAKLEQTIFQSLLANYSWKYKQRVREKANVNPKDDICLFFL